MIATAELKRSLYAVQEAWRPIMRRAKKDKAARDAILFGAKAMRAKSTTKAGLAQAAPVQRIRAVQFDRVDFAAPVWIALEPHVQLSRPYPAVGNGASP